MEIELSQRQIDAIAYRVATIVLNKIHEKNVLPEMVTTAEAARILHITPQRVREKVRNGEFASVKDGDNKQGRILIDRNSLIR